MIGPASSPASTPGLEALRTQAGRDPRGAARQVAVQFEAHFMETVFKGLRAAMAPGEGDSSGQQAFTGMLDAQFARQFAGRPGGLADLIERQLSRQMQALPAAAAAAPAPSTPPAAAPASPPPGKAADARSGFLQRMLPHAQAAERATGVPASYILGQAALESGWGRSEIRHPDGSASFNLLGVKAGARWRGEVAVATTTEYQGGQSLRRQERFRSYESYAQAFTDYARLLATSPRYAQALRATDSPDRFAGEMQRAGYATDPRYADKLARVIHHTQALQRVAAQGVAAPGSTA